MTSAVSPPGMTAATTAPHEQVFPADASQVGAARAFLSAIVAGRPAAHDAVLGQPPVTKRPGRARARARYGIRTILPVAWPAMLYRCASATWLSG